MSSAWKKLAYHMYMSMEIHKYISSNKKNHNKPKTKSKNHDEVLFQAKLITAITDDVFLTDQEIIHLPINLQSRKT